MIAHGDTFKHAKQYRRHALWRNVACTFQLRLAWDVDDYVLHALSSDTQIQKRYLSQPLLLQDMYQEDNAIVLFFAECRV